MPNEANKWIKKALRRTKREYSKKQGGKCADCGKKKRLEFAHLRKTPILKLRKKGLAGRKERYYDILQHPKSYALKCHSCNMKAKR